jgi:hypothetical protein
MLLKLALSDRDGLRGGIEQDGARRGRALIDCQDVIRPPHEPTIRCSVLRRKGF